jgi:hypothetical protein
MSYVIAIDHNRGISYWISYEKNFGTIALAKRYETQELAERCLENVADYIPEMLEDYPMYCYLGYDRATLRVVEHVS